MNLDSIIAAAGARFPGALLRPLLRYALGGYRLALCLHRVVRTRPSSSRSPATFILEEDLDALVALLVGALPPSAEPWLTVSFDDGYADAAAYVQSRAARFPQVEWLFFVCPEKTELRAGFRWDLPGGSSGPGPAPSQENHRPELRGLANTPACALASLEACRRIAALPNVALGNHTNSHLRQTDLTEEQARSEYEASTRSFEGLFGPQVHFAFPFGTPEREFNGRHVELLRATGSFFIWSTERRPYRPEERRPGAVLPRLPVDGRLGWRQLGLWIAALALRHRLRGGGPRYPLPSSPTIAGAAAQPPSPGGTARAQP